MHVRTLLHIIVEYIDLFVLINFVYFLFIITTLFSVMVVD
jgi:hypothetical protein